MILIIDNYDSFTYNLVHLVAAHTDEYKVIRNDAITIEEVRALKPSKILISPGPGRPENAGITEALIRELGQTTPVLGVCLGYQAIGNVFGAKVTHAPSLMHGKTSVIEHDSSGIFNNVEQNFTATRYHSLVLEPDSIPDVLQITCKTPDGVIMGVKHKDYPVEGIQFHPESILTTEGPKLIENWIKS
ncbi:MAG: aminodeoxychorismate/anthranilate synthase component II [Balneolia bacterium]|nr:aminodeoxychorismate/anthranilate synthase component II [Balneolia bacterium]